MLTLAISQIKLRVQNRVSTLIIHNPPCSEPRWLPLPYHTNYSEKLTTGSLCHLYKYIYIYIYIYINIKPKLLKLPQFSTSAQY